MVTHELDAAITFTSGLDFLKESQIDNGACTFPIELTVFEDTLIMRAR